MSRRVPGPMIAPLLLLLLAGCDVLGLGDDDEPDLRIHALESSVLAGGTQGIRIENRADRSIVFNPCPHVFEQRIGGVWTPLPQTRPAACTDHLEELPAGDNSGFVVAIQESLAAGIYRIVFEGFWFRELDPPQTEVISFDPLPRDERTTGVFEIVEVSE